MISGPKACLCIMVTGLIASVTGTTCAQISSGRPIRIVTSEPGGSLDFSARLIAQELSRGTERTVVVDNRGGASGAIAAQIVAKAPPDGHTLLLYGNAVWVEPLMRSNVPYDPVRDFSPITLVASTPGVLAVHPSVPAKSVKELIALAKAKPGELNYASSSTGAVTHLAAELFKALSGVSIARIPYKGTGPAVNALIGGEVQVMFPAAPAAIPHVRAGRLRALAITSAKPSPSLPELPTIAASGVPDYESVLLIVIFAPARMPAPVADRLNRVIVEIINRPGVREKFSSLGADPVGSTPEQLLIAMKAEVVRLSKVVKNAGIGAE